MTKYEKKEKKAKEKIFKFLLKQKQTDSRDNLIKWFKIITEDRWWDYVFLLRIIKKKLKLMEQEWDNSSTKDYKKYKKQIRDTKKLLKKIIKNDFTKKEEKKHQKKWGELKQVEEDSAYFILKYEKATTKEKEEEAREEMNNINKLKEKRLKKTEKKFFKKMRKEYKNWWD